MEAERVDVVVVGTGWNGLISAKTYLDLVSDANLVLIDDQKSIGGVWCAEKIYPSLFAQIRHGQFEYSFYPMRHEGITPDGYVSAQTINRYLNEFAQDYDLMRRTRLETKVEKVERLSEYGWRLHIEGKPPIECAKLIYASGATSHPVVPSWPQQNFNTPVIHSSEIGSHLQSLTAVKTATVVGAAKSAYDAVFLLLEAGVQVNWVIREDGSGPLAIMPPTIMGFNTMDAVATNIMSHLGSSIQRTQSPLSRFFNKTYVGRAIAQTFWTALTKIAALHAGYDKTPNAQKLRPEPVGNGIFWATAGLGCASVPGFWKAFHAGDCTVHKSEIVSLSDRATVTLRSGAQFRTDYIVMCTGYDKSYHPFSPELQHVCGLSSDPKDDVNWAKAEARAEQIIDGLLPSISTSPFSGHERPHAAGHTHQLLHGPSRHYRRLIVPELAVQGDRSIYFPGFIHTIYSPLVSEVQALWGVAFLLDLVELPPLKDMETEVAEWNVWTRKRYPTQGRKHAYAIYDFFAYIDVLLGDLGIDTRRKSNPLAELLLPKYPRDYHNLMDEFRISLATKRGSVRMKGQTE